MRHASLLLALLVPAAWASDIQVQPGQSIQAAIDSAVDGDCVLVSAGVYVERITYQGKAIEVVGVEGWSKTTLQAPFGSAVEFWNGETASSVLRGFTVTGGNTLKWGGGISCFDGAGFASPTILDCRITGNNASLGGGGVAGSPRLVRCVIDNNTTAPADGGGVWGGARLESCMVSDNRAADGWGGGIAFVVGDAAIVDSVVARNVSAFSVRGGGVYVSSNVQSALVSDSLILENDVSDSAYVGHGAGIYSDNAATQVVRCTLVGNTSDSLFGSGVGGFEGQGTLTSCIVRDNALPNVQGAQASFCNIGGGYAGSGNFDAEPLYVAGGPGGDYHLRSNSPCIGAGAGGEDVGAYPFRSLYTRANVLATHADDPSWNQISVSLGGRQEFWSYLDALHGGEIYVLLGSLSPGAPGFVLNGLQVDLNIDNYTLFLLSGALPGLFHNAFGALNGLGQTTASLNVPAGSPAALAGTSAGTVLISFNLGTFQAAAVSDVELTHFQP